MAISTLQLFRQGVNGMLDQQDALLKTQLQLSSGKRVQNPADDPTAATHVLGLTETLSITEQYQTNIISARNRLEAEETVLESADDILQRARELALSSLNGSINAKDRASTAPEVRQLLNEMLGIANRKDGNGEYLFAGSRDRVTPFSSNGSGTFSYAGDQGQRHIKIAPDRLIADGDSGLDVFMKIPASGGGYEDVFSTLYNFATNLENNTLNPAVLDQLDNALDHILTVRAGTGARQNALDNQQQINESLKLQIQTTRSEIEDLDFAAAASRLNQQTLTLQAAQQAFAKVQGLSLFNFL